MAKTAFESVDQYIAAQPAAARKTLERVRGAIRKGLPGAEETISYQIPAYQLNRRAVIYFAGWKEHYSLYPASAALVAAFAKELAPFEIRKSTIRFPLSRPVPSKLIEGIARFRAGEAAERRKKTSGSTAPGPEQQLGAFIAKFAPPDQRLIRSVRKAVRRLFPTAHEMVYDNYNFFVIGYSPTERPSDAIVSIAARANSVGLCFIHGVGLPDPAKLLEGAGNQTRFIHLESAAVLERPEVRALVAAAIARSKAPLPESGRGKLIIRSVSAKQRPRRKA